VWDTLYTRLLLRALSAGDCIPEPEPSGTCGSVTFFVLDSVLYRPYSNDLDSCKHLDLSSMQLTTLPDGVFAGLSSLQRLNLTSNQLTTLPVRILSGLSSLTYLGLDVGVVMSCPEGAFYDLTELSCLPCPAGSFSNGKNSLHIKSRCSASSRPDLSLR
jgi:hypothetical protein